MSAPPSLAGLCAERRQSTSASWVPVSRRDARIRGFWPNRTPTSGLSTETLPSNASTRVRCHTGELLVVIASARSAPPDACVLAQYLGLTMTAPAAVSTSRRRCGASRSGGSGLWRLEDCNPGRRDGRRRGQAASSRIENYLGFDRSPAATSQRAVVQAGSSAPTSPARAGLVAVRRPASLVRLSDGNDVAGRGDRRAGQLSSTRRPRLADFEGNGVLRSHRDARLCAGSPVVVRGGNSAGQAALFLAASGSPSPCHAATTWAPACRVTSLTGSRPGSITSELNTRIPLWTVTRSHVGTCHHRVDAVLPCVALFSFIGADPAADWLSGCAALDERGFVLTDRSLGEEHLDGRWESLGRRPLPFETSYPGLFAVGDVRAGSTKRVAAAVGEGSAAVRSVHEYLAFAH